MKRFCLISCGAAASLFALAQSASAEPAVLYIPTEAIDLNPSGEPDTPCAGVSMSDSVAGLGCSDLLAEPRTQMPHPMAENLTADLQAAFDAWDIHITNDRPPAYLKHYMLMPSPDEATKSMAYSCTAALNHCGGRRRDSVGFTNDGTMNCTDPNASQTVIYAAGRMMGLEGVDDPTDPMHYPPDFATPALVFQDVCFGIVGQYNKMGMPTPTACLNEDHEGCDIDMQNSVAELMAHFGARQDDSDPPVISNVMPAPDTDFPDEGAMVTFSAQLEDADPIVGVQWRVTSPVFDADFGGTITACTNSHCDFDLLGGDPFKTTDSAWSWELSGLPGATYDVEIVASDYHGNESEVMSYSFTVAGGVSAEDTGDDSMTAGMTASSTMTTASSMTGFLETGDMDETGDEEDTGEEDMMDEGGCGCTQSPGAGGALLMLFGIFGFLMTRRPD